MNEPAHTFDLNDLKVGETGTINNRTAYAFDVTFTVVGGGAVQFTVPPGGAMKVTRGELTAAVDIDVLPNDGLSAT